MDFEKSVAMFFADHQRTQQQEPTSPYLRLPAVARFQICQYLIADHNSDIPICLSDGRFMREVWSDDEYTSLAAAMGPLQSYLAVSFSLRADMMVAFLMIERFHVTLSPFVGPHLNPLATLWCNKYGHFIQQVVVELDLTRLGFGPGKEACKLRAGTINMDDLIGTFVKGQLRRKNQSTLRSLVLLCRRFWGERPSDHLPPGSKPAAEQNDQRSSTEPEQTFAAKRSSFGADFSYCPDEFLRICEPFVRLEGLVDSMRLCGFSNGYTHSLLRRIFPVPERSDEIKLHTYRVAPSSIWPRISGQSSWIDKGHGKFQLDDHSRQYLRGLCFPEGAVMLTQPYENPLNGLLSITATEIEYIQLRNSVNMSAPVPANFDAQEADNLEDIEKQFAVKVVQHMETYWNILEKVKGSSLRLTKIDDEIYEHLKTDFPEFDPAATINEDEMKSKTGKERWRKFMMAYEKRVDDYNFGTMVRASPKSEYGQNEVIFAPRMQFYAIEIARNRNGLNDWIYEKAQAAKSSS
ncbi:hypothetical protein CORC01_00127 [Colletotrichum orchidophilum]|uniref:Protein PBDC1 homolog n=1 Tax=Colletotrichum orchidophilum TaxID=1209926 RepID=A0A1G4BTJ9_9PEZI|nr:uncharacterized protein CORC01_00127 [Colletotrichum orchidophilum]OHF04656.1 hypothetical protein CORC01_00127 [Colletotrichum orchidophilum]